MDDFIYIIALIAWVVFAFYRKSQKKSEAAREAQRKYQPEEEETGTFQTLEEILLGREPIREVQAVPADKSFTTDGIPPVMGETAFEREYNRMGITSIEEMDKPLSMQKTKRVDTQDDKILLEDDVIPDWKARVDLRQAVIYSEILNRPYV